MMVNHSYKVPWYRSLRFKLVVAAITVEVVMLTALLANSFRLLDQAIESQAQSRLEALVPLLDAALAGRVFQRDHAEVDAILDRLTKNSLTEVNYIAVFDTAGNVIASSRDIDPRTLPSEDNSVTDALSDLSYDVRLPLTILANEVGSVRFGLSLASMVATKDQVVSEGFFIALVEIFLSLLLLASGGYLITRHILSLTEGARRITSGDYGSQIPVTGSDEIAGLANDFNTMSAAIASHVNTLRASEMRFQAIFNAVNEAIFIHDLATGMILDVNKRMCEMFACTPEEAKAHDPGEFSSGIYPYTADGAFSKMQAAAAGIPQIFDWQARALDGRIFWVEVSLRLARIGDDERIIAVVRDITERKKNEEHILRLAVAIEQAAEDIIITDVQGVIQYVNPAQSSTTGYPPEELIGSDLTIFKGDKSENDADREMWDAIRKGSKWAGRLETYAKDGRKVLQDTIVAPIHTRDKTQITGYVSTRRDITHQVETERLLAQSQKMEAIGTLAGGIAHDFNNILSAIIGYTDLAREKTGGENILSEYLNSIFDASIRARDLVQQILAFSRKADPQKIPLQISPIIQETLKLLRATIPASIEIRQNIKTAATVLADPAQIHQVMMNLCTNAYQAMLEKGGVLAVSAREIVITADTPSLPVDGLPSGNYVVIEVSDTGYGIDRDTLKKIFDPYFTTKGRGSGTGLGLAVVHGIVKSHGGKISVYSESGKGSTFHVYLPVTTATAEKFDYPERESSLTGNNERVMFVDDEEPIRVLVERYLAGNGYQVDVFTNGLDAISRLSQDPKAYDLVITDMTMPGMDGKTLAQKVLALRPDLPIILCTGYSALINAESARAMGIREYVQKPVVISDLLVHMKKALGNI